MFDILSESSAARPLFGMQTHLGATFLCHSSPYNEGDHTMLVGRELAYDKRRISKRGMVFESGD